MSGAPLTTMAEGDDPPAKKPRLQTLIEKFHSFDEKPRFCFAYRKSLCNDKSTGLVSLKIRNCDADVERPFSSALCRTERILCNEEPQSKNGLYPIGIFFRKGVEILNNITGDEMHMPEDPETVAVLEPLLTYIFDENSHDCLRSISDAKNETQLMVALARHFFMKLSVAKSCMVNKFAITKGFSCDCKDCQKQEAQIMQLFGDTSIGNGKVWHGSLDIILGNCDIGIGLAQDESHSSGALAPVEDKEHVESDLKKVQIRDQALSQAITFSFLQRQRHKSAEHFFFPFILVSKKFVQFFFYDSENDILIQSPPSTFLVLDSTNKKLVLNYKTIISTWLVLNYKYLCSGPPAYVLKSEKAGFFQKAGDKLEVYRTQLKFQNVETELPNPELFETKNAIASGLCEDVPFEWPERDFPPRPK